MYIKCDNTFGGCFFKLPIEEILDLLEAVDYPKVDVASANRAGPY